MPWDPRYTTLERSAKLMFSAISGRFHGLYPMIFGSRRISMPRDRQYTTLEGSAKLVFSPISGRFRGL